MARIHYWQYIVNEDGEPVENAIIRFYLADSTTEAEVFLHPTAGTTTTTSVAELKTNSNGFFEVWFGDELENTGGYEASQKFKLTWSKAGIATGVIDKIDIYPTVFQVDETDNISQNRSVRNKLISNELAYSWESHISMNATEGPHNFAAVDYNDTDITYNKLVSNNLMNYVFSVLTSGGSVSITASAAIVKKHEIDTWTVDGDLYYSNLDHFIGNGYPIVQVRYTATNETVEPYKIKSINTDRIQLWMSTNDKVVVTIIG